MFDSLFSSGMTSVRSWWVVGGAHTQAFTFSSQDHGRLSNVHTSNYGHKNCTCLGLLCPRGKNWRELKKHHEYPANTVNSTAQTSPSVHPLSEAIVPPKKRKKKTSVMTKNTRKGLFSPLRLWSIEKKKKPASNYEYYQNFCNYFGRGRYFTA